MKYKVKWIEEHMGITRNMIRRYEKKGVISKNEEGKDREFDEVLITKLIVNTVSKLNCTHN